MEHAVESHKQTEPRRSSHRVDSVAKAAPPVQSPMLQLQQQAGNQAMQQLLRSTANRSAVAAGNPSDYNEGDRNPSSSGRIMRSHADAAAATSCSCGGEEEMCDECRQKQATISMKAAGPAPHTPSRTALDHMRRSPGHPLDHATRAFFEPRFGRDLSGVHIHTDSNAARSAAALNANAYSLGSDIWFATGKFQPQSDEGRKLLAHEMAHTVQQAGSQSSASTMHKQSITVGRVDDPMEAEADRVADTVMRSETPAPLSISPDRASTVRGNILGDALDSIEDAGEWVGGKIEEGGEAALEGAEYVGGKIVDAGEWVGEEVEEGAEAVGGAAKAAGKWALGKLENAWDCLMSMGTAAGNILTGDVSSLTDLLGIPAPEGADPSTLDTLIAVLKHPCLQMIPGYGLVSGMVGILEKVGKFLVGAWHLIQNPQPIIDGIQAAIGKMITAIPGYVSGLVQKALQSLGSNLKEHGEGVWRRLEPKLEYLAQNWWDVIKQTGWTLLWPWPSVGKDLGEIWDHIKSAGEHLWHLRFSKAIDEILAVERGVNNILGSLYGWFFIASVLVGAILGAIFGGGVGAIPGALAGAEVAGVVGEGLLAVTVGIESASILKAVYNLFQPEETQKDKETDYEQIASSSLTLAITGVMFVLGEIAVKFAQGLFSRVAGLFRRAGADVEGAVTGVSKGPKGAPDVEGPKVDGGKIEPLPEKPPTVDPEAASAAKAQDLPKIEQQVHSPDGVHPPKDPKIAAEYDAEIDVGDHTYRRSNSDGTWCKFSDPICGVEIPEIKTDVDTALAPKPEELPPEVAAEILDPQSPEAITTDAALEPAPLEPAPKSSKLKPGSPEHKAARWAEYEARGGKWKYERWSNVYERNMIRARLATAAEKAYHEKLGWGEISGNKPGVQVEGVERRFDIVDLPTRRGVEVKTGDIYLTQEIAWEILRDKILVDKGWKIEWHFEGRGSKPLLKALKDANITVT